MLKEKQSYVFKVVRMITLPDDTRSWVLTHTGADRYMLPCELYTDYGIAEGIRIRCRVDKINCTGRIFLEPEHPYYREGGDYHFTFIRDLPIEDAAGNHLWQLELAGIHGDRHHCLSLQRAHRYKIGDPVPVRLISVKKGRLEFILSDLEENRVMQAGAVSEWTITGDADDEHWLILGPLGIKSKLEKGYYPNHGLKTGSVFRGSLQKWQDEGLPLIEPEHPVYRPGQVYLFQIQSPAETNPPDETHGAFLVVTDCFGHQIKVFQHEPQLPDAGQTGAIRCRVVRLKRGVPVLRAL